MIGMIFGLNSIILPCSVLELCQFKDFARLLDHPVYIYGTVSEKIALRIIIYIKCYKNASRLNRYIFRTVNAINFLFSALYTTPFPYDKIHFGVLHLLRASIATFDTPPGSNPP